MKIINVSCSVIVMTTLFFGTVAFSANKTSENALKKIQVLQSSIIRNKNEVEGILNLKSFTISKEIENIILNSNTRFSLPQYTLFSLLSYNTNKTYGSILDKQDGLERLFMSVIQKPDGKNLNSKNQNENIFTLIVLNPQNYQVLREANQYLEKSEGRNEFVITRMFNIIKHSIDGKRFVTYDAARDLADKIADINSKTQEIEEERVFLSLNDTLVVEKFQNYMKEWMNKKIIFIGVNKDGFDLKVFTDYSAALSIKSTLPIPEIKLKKDYSALNIAKVIKQSIIQTVTYYREMALMQNFQFYVSPEYIVGRKYYPGQYIPPYELPFKSLNDFSVVVSDDKKNITISSKKFHITSPVKYLFEIKLEASRNGDVFYRHEALNYLSKENFYRYNEADIDLMYNLISSEQIEINKIHKNYGYEKFESGKGNMELSIDQ